MYFLKISGWFTAAVKVLSVDNFSRQVVHLFAISELPPPNLVRSISSLLS